MPDYLYLDIETIPTGDEAVIAEIAASITPPGSMKKPETIEKWEAEEKPALVEKAIAQTALNGALGRICCIGWAWNDDDTKSSTTASERALLSYVLQGLDDKRPSNQRPVIVGHFVSGFDIRFIWQRAIVHGIRLPSWFPRDPKPWSDSVHDTMNIWAGARDSISLDNLCKALGLPGKGNTTGADVAGLWANGEHEAIAEYCRADVERVRQIHKKMLVSMGEVA